MSETSRTGPRPTGEATSVGAALAWIVEVFELHGVPYQVVGGLAARAYGAVRPIVDVDLYVPFELAGAALEEIRSHVYWGPEHYVDDCWDLTYLKADFRGQKVELGDSSSDPRFFDKAVGRWVPQRVHYEAGVGIELFEVRAAVMPEEELVRYKLALGREVDLSDVEQITRRRTAK
jgi:hypothetical protein